MRLAGVTITPDSADCPRLDPAVLLDALWSAVTADDLVEHLAIDAATTVVHIGVFSTHTGAAAAQAAAHHLVRRVLHRSPVLRRWAAVESCDVRLDGLLPKS